MILENKITIHRSLDFSDVLQANRLYRSATMLDKKGRRLAGIIYLLLGLIYLAGLLIQPGSGQHNNDLSFLVVVIFILAGLEFIFDFILTPFIWIGFRQNIQSYLEPYEITIDENGITYQSQNVNLKYEWAFFKEGVEGKNSFILIYRKRYSIFPKKAFQSENQVELFRNFLKNSLPKFSQYL